MGKLIRNVEELPEWFDIRPYEQWEDKDPQEAVRAVADRIFLCGYVCDMCCSGRYHPTERTIEAALLDLAAASDEPFRRLETLSPLGTTPDGEFAVWDCRRQDRKEISAAAEKKVSEVLDGPISGADSRHVYSLTIWDAMECLNRNEELITEIKNSARTVASENGWSYESVRDAMFKCVPMFGDSSSLYLAVNGKPTIDAEVHEIRHRLIRHNQRDISSRSNRYTDVRKLFEHRVAAHADLTIWSFLSGKRITRACLANALFPGGEFGEHEMKPSKSVGRFFERLKGGYMKELVAKAAEMEKVQ